MRNSNGLGWVRLHRKIEENPIWMMETFSKGQAWVDLFLNANFKENTFSIRGNIVTVKRGQLGWSELTMAKRWRWSRNKVRRFLNWLETEQQIKQQKNSLTTVITIINYDEYQNETEQQTEQQKDSRRYTNNNDKNEKNDNKLAKASTRVETLGESRNSKTLPIPETNTSMSTDVFAKVHGNEEVNKVINKLSELTPTGKLDGTKLDNRRRAYNLLQSYGIDTVLKAIGNIPGSFYEGKITTLRKLGNHLNELLALKKKGGGTIISWK